MSWSKGQLRLTIGREQAGYNNLLNVVAGYLAEARRTSARVVNSVMCRFFHNVDKGNRTIPPPLKSFMGRSA